MIRDIVLNGATALTGALAPMIVAVVLTRLLPPDQVGQYSLLMWVIGLAAGLASLGAPTAVARYGAELSADPAAAARFVRYALRRQMRWAGLIAVAGGFVAAWLLHHWTWAIPAALAAAPAAVVIVSGAAYRGLLRFGALALRQAAAAVVFIATVVTALWIAPRVAVASAAVVLHAWVSALIYLQGLPHSAGLPAEGILARYRRTVGRLAALGAIDLIVWQRSEVFFLGLLRSPHEVALYALPYTFVGALMLVPASISGVLLPYIARAPENRVHTDTMYGEGMRHLAVTALPVAVGAILFATPIIRVVFGAAYLGGVAPLQVLAATTALAVVASAGSAVLVSEESIGFMIRWGVAAAAVNVGLAIMLVPPWGALGAATANGTAQVFAVAVTMVYLVRVRRIPVPWRSLACIGGAAGLAGAAALLAWQLVPASLIGLIVAGAVGLVVFVGAGRATGELRRAPMQIP